MLGSLDEAEDLVQETMVRAWKSRGSFEGRSSLRTWLYKIATHACLDALEKRSRRSLPTVAYPRAEPGAPFEPVTPEAVWIDPYPDEWLPDSLGDPAGLYATRESISLAFQVALQLLPARQRAVLVLRDVLDWKAGEVATLLDTSVSAVNSMLHRARTTLGRHHRSGADRQDPAELGPKARDLLDGYVTAWESADVTGLVTLLAEDAVLAMPPIPSWYQGRDAILAVLANVAFGDRRADRWRLRPASGNMQPAFGFYEADRPNGLYRPVAVQILTLSGDSLLISEIMAFMRPTLVVKFGLPRELTR